MMMGRLRNTASVPPAEHGNQSVVKARVPVQRQMAEKSKGIGRIWNKCSPPLMPKGMRNPGFDVHAPALGIQTDVKVAEETTLRWGSDVFMDVIGANFKPEKFATWDATHVTLVLLTKAEARACPAGVATQWGQRALRVDGFFSAILYRILAWDFAQKARRQWAYTLGRDVKGGYLYVPKDWAERWRVPWTDGLMGSSADGQPLEPP